MQLKFKRSSVMKGMIGKKKFYRVDALLQLNPEEQRLFEAHDRMSCTLDWLLDRQPEEDDPTGGFMATTIKGLIEGAGVESTDINVPIQAEDLIQQACQQALKHALGAETFNGQERVVQVDTGEAKVIARA